MNRLSILHDALVFVGGGQKVLFLRNTGDSTLPNLTTERVLTRYSSCVDEVIE